MSALKLTFEYPAHPAAKVAAPRLAECLRLAGVELKLVEVAETELEAGLRAGRRFDMAYRIGNCAEPVREAGPLICPGYDAPPAADGLAAIASDRTREVLLALERAPQWAAARELVLLLDRETRDELPVLPLWQIEEHFAWRDNLRGPSAATEHLYHSVGSWEIEPWYARDPW